MTEVLEVDVGKHNLTVLSLLGPEVWNAWSFTSATLTRLYGVVLRHRGIAVVSCSRNVVIRGLLHVKYSPLEW